MAETKDRKGIWQAEFWANGKRIRKSTGIAVGATRAEQRASKQLAQQVADNMERRSNGAEAYSQAADALCCLRFIYVAVLCTYCLIC
jgi:hypothetical protein